MAIEKYLLFLMPRQMKDKKWIDRLSHSSSSRRSQSLFSCFYADSALGLSQYKLSPLSAPRVSAPDKAQGKAGAHTTFLGLLPSRIRFPYTNDETSLSSWSGSDAAPLTPPISLTLSRLNRYDAFSNPCREHDHANREHAFPPRSLDLLQIGIQKGRAPLHKGFVRQTISLHCRSLQVSPDMQDIAQSVSITLEGSLSLELS